MLPTKSNLQSYSLAPKTFDEAIKFSELLAQSDFVPKDYKGKAGNILVAIQWGYEVGMQPLQALQNIAVINGRPALWGDAVLGLVKGSGLLEYIKEEADETKAVCRVKRKDEPNEVVRSFTVDDAKKAGLLERHTWKQYRKRMLQMRARSWALRDAFPDVLKGMQIREEMEDLAYIEEKQSKNLPPLKEIKSALSQLGLEYKEDDGKIIADGNTFANSKTLKELGFAYDDGKWCMPHPEVEIKEAEIIVENETKKEKKPQTNLFGEPSVNTLDELKNALAEIGLEITDPKANSKGHHFVLVKGNVEGLEDRLVALGFKKSSSGFVRQIDDLMPKEEPAEEDAIPF